MKCYDLFKLSFGSLLTLEAGVEGLGRDLNWIYFADSVPLEEIPIYLNGKELIILYGISLNGDYEILYNLLPQFAQKQIAGLLISLGSYIPTIPDHLKELAELYKIPIFTYSVYLKSVEMSREICNMILADEKSKDSETVLLSNLLFNKNLSKQEIDEVILDYKILTQKDAKIGVIKYVQYHDSTKHQTQLQHSLYISHLIYTKIDKYFNLHGITALLLRQDDSIIFFAKDEIIQKKEFRTALKDIQHSIQNTYPNLFLYVGIGKICTTPPYNFRSSYENALTSVDIAISQKASITPYYYEHLGIWGVLSAINNREILQNYYQQTFSLLIDYDRMNNGDLLNTLKEYIKNDFNLQKTADLMYIHKNTLKYRIEKIETILGHSLKSSDAISDIVIAFKIGQLLSL